MGKKHLITAVRNLTESTFVIRMKRNNLPFKTGQFIILRQPGTLEQREYSVYSGENDNYLEVLVREVITGRVSPRLKSLKPGDELEVEGPFGFFQFQPELFPSRKFLFVATGTGISPFHSFVRTYPELNYHLIHGVRYGEEAYEHGYYNSSAITLCTSGDHSGHFFGRVTTYLKNASIESNTPCFLCGNSLMIQDAFDLLTGKNIPAQNIHTEVYY